MLKKIYKKSKPWPKIKLSLVEDLKKTIIKIRKELGIAESPVALLPKTKK